LTEHYYQALDSKNIIGMVALDLQKAFDTVNHSILLDKLNFYGIKGISNKWFQNYLSDRLQTAYINDTKSTSLPVINGVPQGSILGPLLFILYINDLPNCLQTCYANMYADDTTIYSIGPNVDSITKNLQTDLDKVNQWLYANKLSLHIGKTNCMIICSKQKQISLKKTTAEAVTSGTEHITD
jgi:retron-type reverse transcriptase